MTRRVATAVIAGTIGISMAHPADRATAVDVPTRYVPSGGPVIAGEQAVWATGRPDRGVDINATRPNTGRAVRLQSFPARTPYVVEPGLAASGDRLAVEIQDVYVGGGDPETQALYRDVIQSFAGTLTTPLQALASACPLPFGALDVVSVSAAGTRVAFRGTACPGNTNIVPAAIRDFSQSPPMTTQLPAGSQGMRLAGDLVAFAPLDDTRLSSARGHGEIVVRDLTRGADLYRVDEQAIPGSIVALVLQPDGTVGFVVRTYEHRRTGFRVGIVSSERPHPAMLSLPLAGHYAVRWAGGRLLVMTAPTYSTSEVSDGTLEVVDEAGRVLHVVARGVEDRYLNERFDTNGRDVVYVTRGCRGAVIHRVSLSARTQSYRPPARCPLAGASATRLSRSQIRVHFSCVGLTARCIAWRGVLTTAGGRRRALLGEVRPIDGGVFTLFSPYVNVTLNRRGQRFLASRGRKCGRVTLTVGEGSYVVSGEYYAGERRSAVVCISSPRRAHNTSTFAG